MGSRGFESEGRLGGQIAESALKPDLNASALPEQPQYPEDNQALRSPGIPTDAVPVRINSQLATEKASEEPALRRGTFESAKLTESSKPLLSRRIYERPDQKATNLGPNMIAKRAFDPSPPQHVNFFDEPMD